MCGYRPQNDHVCGICQVGEPLPGRACSTVSVLTAPVVSSLSPPAIQTLPLPSSVSVGYQWPSLASVLVVNMFVSGSKMYESLARRTRPRLAPTDRTCAALDQHAPVGQRDVAGAEHVLGHGDHLERAGDRVPDGRLERPAWKLSRLLPEPAIRSTLPFLSSVAWMARIGIGYRARSTARSLRPVRRRRRRVGRSVVE